MQLLQTKNIKITKEQQSKQQKTETRQASSVSKNQNGGLKESVQNDVKVGVKEKPKNVVKEQKIVEPSKARNGKETVVIAGVSLLQGQKGWLMSSQKSMQCKAFSRSTRSDMDHYLNPIISRKPDYLFLHVETNDLPNYNRDEVAIWPLR